MTSLLYTGNRSDCFHAYAGLIGDVIVLRASTDLSVSKVEDYLKNKCGIKQFFLSALRTDIGKKRTNGDRRSRWLDFLSDRVAFHAKMPVSRFCGEAPGTCSNRLVLPCRLASWP
jgi:hypothetical protein